MGIEYDYASDQTTILPSPGYLSGHVGTRTTCAYRIQHGKLERAHTLLARRLLGREGWGATKTDQKHKSVSNVAIRKKLGIPTLASLLRQRRLMWVRSMLRDPEYHFQYWATMFGQFEWETKQDLDEQGVPTAHAIPALRQLHNDLKAAFPTHTGFQQSTPNWQDLVKNDEDIGA